MNEPIYIPQDSPFLTTDTRSNRWAIPYDFECLNARIDRLLGQNADLIRGQKILDIGSHIGTFAFAALQLGAGFVHGVDAEERTVERCLDLFQRLDAPESAYSFEAAEAFSFLENLPENSFDTVFCFGLLYYVLEPYRLIRLMSRAAKKAVLIDTFTAAYAAVQGKDALGIFPNIKDETLDLPLMLVSLTQTEKKDYKLPQSFRSKGNDLSLTTLPTRALLEIWFDSLGLDYEFLDWKRYAQRELTFRDLFTPEQKKNSHWADVYASGVRVSYRLGKKG